jgi:hypothetical protein
LHADNFILFTFLHGLGQQVSLIGDADDCIDRRVDGLTVTPFNMPPSCIGGYYPEMNPLVPLDHHDQLSKTPAYKSVPVRIVSQDERQG